VLDDFLEISNHLSSLIVDITEIPIVEDRLEFFERNRSIFGGINSLEKMFSFIERDSRIDVLD